MPITQKDIADALAQYDLHKTRRRKWFSDHPSVQALRRFNHSLAKNLISQPLAPNEYFQLANILLNAKMKANSSFYPKIVNPLIGEMMPFFAILKANHAFTVAAVNRLFHAKKNSARESAELITKAAIAKNLLSFINNADSISHALEYLNYHVDDFNRLNNPPLTYADLMCFAQKASAKSLYLFIDNYFKETPIELAVYQNAVFLQRFLEDEYTRKEYYHNSTRLLAYLQIASPQQKIAGKEIIYNVVSTALTTIDKFNAFFAKASHIEMLKTFLPHLAERLTQMSAQSSAHKKNRLLVQNEIDLVLSNILKYNTQDVLNDSERINLVLYLMAKSMPPLKSSPLLTFGQFARPISARNEIPNLIHFLDDIKKCEQLPQIIPTIINADIFDWIDHILQHRPRRISAPPH